MIVVGRFYFYTSDDLDDHFRRLQHNDLNLDLPRTTHLDHETKVDMQTFDASDFLFSLSLR